MTKKHLGQLTIKKLLHHGGFFGVNSLVHRFCDAVNAGEVPDAEDLKAVAYALEVLRDDNALDTRLRAFAGRLGIKKKQGKKESSRRAWLKQSWPVVKYYALRDQYLEAGEAEKDAEAAARALVASELGIKDRAMRNRIEEYGESAWLQYQILHFKEPD